MLHETIRTYVSICLLQLHDHKQSGLENCWPLSAIVTKAISAIAKIV